MNSSPNIPTYQEEVAAATTAARQNREERLENNPQHARRSKWLCIGATTLAVGTGILILNRLGLFERTRIVSRLPHHADWSDMGHRLACAPRRLGERVGWIKPKPVTLKRRLGTWMDSTAGNLDLARHRIAAAGTHALAATRSHLHDSRIRSTRIAREHPAVTVGAGLLTFGLMIAAFTAPSFLRND